jgi:hypothetical protein
VFLRICLTCTYFSAYIEQTGGGRLGLVWNRGDGCGRGIFLGLCLLKSARFFSAIYRYIDAGQNVCPKWTQVAC